VIIQSSELSVPDCLYYLTAKALIILINKYREKAICIVEWLMYIPYDDKLIDI